MKLAMGTCLLAAALCGCSTATDRRDSRWEASRSQIEAQREAGGLSAAEAYARLRRQYREIYGSDAGMGPYFAYAGALMTGVERGDIDPREARLLLTAKEQQAVQQASALRAARERYTYPEN